MMSDKSYNLHSLVLELGAAKAGKPPATLGRSLYARVLGWLHLANPEIAEEVHASKIPPLSVSGLLGNRRRDGTQAGDYFAFRIGLLEDRLLQPLLLGLQEWGEEPIVLAKFPFAIRRLYALPDSHSLVRKTDFSSLAQLPARSDIKLRFSSPTSFKQGQNIQTFPLPELVFGSLLRRWNAFAPEELKFPRVEWQGLVSAYELKTHALRLEAGAEIGAQGWARYRFADAEQAKIATAIAALAFFAGVGRKTTMGMGQTEVMPDTTVSTVKVKPKPHLKVNQDKATEDTGDE